MSDLKMTERHVAMLEALNVLSVQIGRTTHLRHQSKAAYEEILAFIQRHADGSLRCADSKTRVDVSREEIEAFREDVKRAWADAPKDRDWFFNLTFNKTIPRWLSTPEQPATEMK